MGDIFRHLVMTFTVVAMLVVGIAPHTAGPDTVHGGHVVAAEHVHGQGHGPSGIGHGSAAHDHAYDTLTGYPVAASRADAMGPGWTRAPDHAVVSALRNLPEQPPKLIA